MSDEIQQAPRAPQPAVAPVPTSAQAQVPTAEPSRANFSRPTTSNGTAQNTATTPSAATFPPPASTQPTTTAPPTTTEEPQTLNDRLNNADRYWKFKGILQTVAIITGLIGIGTVGWSMAVSNKFGFSYGYDSTWSLWPSLLTFSCSVIWCFICTLVFVFRKRPVHPGLRVAIDLILWLGFIGTALLVTVSFTELTQWGEYGDMSNSLGYSTSYGDYELLSNGTWVWEQDEQYTSNSYLRPCERNSTRTSYYDDLFENCAEQDAYINKLWQEKPHRQSVQLTGVVCQFFGLILHLVLFIWACVDCHHHNRKKVSNDAEKLAANIVQTMITNGAVVPPPGQAYMRPWGQQPMGYYQLPPQQGQSYPMMAMYPQQQPRTSGQPMPQGTMAPQGGVVAGPSNEKSEGPRYA